MFAVSKKLMPYATAVSMIVCESDPLVCGPKFIVPRHRRLTTRPRRPTWVNSMARVYVAAGERLGDGERPSRSGSSAPRRVMKNKEAPPPSTPGHDQDGVGPERGGERSDDQERHRRAEDRDHPVQRRDPAEELAGHQPLHRREPDHDQDRDTRLGDERDHHRLRSPS